MIKVHKLKHHLLPSPPPSLCKHTGKPRKARVLLQLKGFHSTTVQNEKVIVVILSSYLTTSHVKLVQPDEQVNDWYLGG